LANNVQDQWAVSGLCQTNTRFTAPLHPFVLRCVASIDDNIGKVLDTLDELGLAKNTIVIYTTNQGFFLGEHGWYDKRWMYEESLRVPLVIRWPGRIKPGTRVKALAQNIDFAPTFLDAGGVKVPDDMQGVSLLPLLNGKTPANWRDAIYYHYYEVGEHNVARHEGVRSDRYKLIHYYDDGEWELFDLQADPQELTSVYTLPRYATIVKQMKAKLKTLKLEYKVPQPTN
jgi:arylsulfatase A-like enzyme